MSENKTPNLEEKLDTLYSAITPDPAFAERLEQKILMQAKELPLSHGRGSPEEILKDNRHLNRLTPDTKKYKELNIKLRGPLWIQRIIEAIFNRPALAWGLALVVFMVLAIGLAGPQRVLAEVQMLLGFAPGVGFVQPGETRLLAAPVEVRQGDITVRIDSVIADAQQTQVTLTATGLPREKFGSAQGPEPQDSQPYLLLPDGTRSTPMSTTVGIGETLQASLSFLPLPAGVDRVTVVLPRLPSVPAGFAPENWSIPLHLQSTAVTRFPQETGIPLVQPYTPATAESSAKGITLRLLQVAQGQEETGLQFQVNWDNPSWKELSVVTTDLRDDAGRVYPRKERTFGLNFEPGSEAPAPGSRTLAFRFNPLDSQARRGIFAINQLVFNLKNEASFTFDPGPNPQPGQTWDLSGLPGSQLEISGVPVHLLSLTLIQNPAAETTPVQKSTNEIVLPEHSAPYSLTLLAQTTTQNGLALRSLSLSLHPDDLMSGSMESLPGDLLRMTIDIPSIPNGPLTLYFPRGELAVSGPWKVEWELPR